MALDPRTPVIVGVGQETLRDTPPAEVPEPAALMARALRLAADDSGAGGALLERADSVGVVVPLSWGYRDPGRAVAEHLGIEAPHTLVTTTGGNSPQMLVDHTAAAVASGRMDVVLVCGAEGMAARQRARRGPDKVWLDWPHQDEEEEGAPATSVGDDRQGANDLEMSHSAAIPTQVYPLFENALGHATGRSTDEHRRAIAQLWSRFSEVGACNRYAWSPHALTSDQIATPTPDNRMIGFPYTKWLNANMTVDQSAALILCSAAAAEAAGVARERWVFPWAGAEAHDHWFVSERIDLCSSPAIRAAATAVFRHTGTTIDDIAHVDLYSCFPSAVQIGAAELGLGLDEPDRPLTVTGGLTFAGGPGNNYVTHSIAAMVQALRADPGSIGLVTALGWYVTKHAMGLYSTQPPREPFALSRPQADVDALPRREFTGDQQGPVEVETWTVMHDRDGAPAIGIVAALLPDGRRTWGNVRDIDTLQTMLASDPIGGRATRRADGTIELE